MMSYRLGWVLMLPLAAQHGVAQSRQPNVLRPLEVNIALRSDGRGLLVKIRNTSTRPVIFSVRGDYCACYGTHLGKRRALTFDGSNADMKPHGWKDVVTLRPRASYEAEYVFDYLPLKGEAIEFTVRELDTSLIGRMDSQSRECCLRESATSNRLVMP